ncbi:MAG: helix-turn-helix domain-containing protein [Verrucomicrobiota bacterium]|nr:helix-turn-helix domain-containing protein [Verrucomicrobiota bacterium]
MAPLRIGFLGYENACALDLVGPAEAFASALRQTVQGKTEKCYAVSIIGLTRRPFVAESGIVFQPTTTISRAPQMDTLIIPGGHGLRVPETNRKAAKWIAEQAKTTRRVVSVCTGIYGLAATGLLDGRRVATHWRFAHDVARRFPRVKMEANALFVKDGKFYSSAGVTAGIDLALALIEEDFGAKIALGVAREMVVYLKRSGGQEQYSEPLQFQTNSGDRFAELVDWMTNHPSAEMSIGSLAERAALSPRQFFRRFKEHFGSSPATFVETLRLNEARRRLAMGQPSIESVAAAVGFRGADTFRRAFERRFRVSPSKYRRSFGLPSERAPNESFNRKAGHQKNSLTARRTSRPNQKEPS